VKRPEKPENLIPEEKMVDVLTEAYLINAARSFDKRTIIENRVKLDSFIYKRFNIDSLQFAQSNAFYTSDLNKYNDLFTKVQTRIELLKKNADSMLIKISLEEKRIDDSIEAATKDSLGLKMKKDTVVRQAQLIDPASTIEL
jgi:hypothetical protein